MSFTYFSYITKCNTNLTNFMQYHTANSNTFAVPF